MRCPSCAEPLGAYSTRSFTSTDRIDGYWCDTCRAWKSASVPRDFDREDQWLDYSGPVTWISQPGYVATTKGS